MWLFRRSRVPGAGALYTSRWSRWRAISPEKSRFSPEVEVVQHPDEAAWLRPRLLPSGHGLGTRTGSVVPTGFDSYVSVFHPPTIGGREGRREARWSDVAERTGSRTHPGMQWDAIAHTGDDDGLIDVGNPWPGSLTQAQSRSLAEILRRYTSTPEQCWFAVWEGWADLPETNAIRVRHPSRKFILLSGELDAVTRPLWAPPQRGEAYNYQSPNLWWPEDQAWVVGTELDFRWTYVASSAACIDDIVGDQRLEAYEVRVDDRGDEH